MTLSLGLIAPLPPPFGGMANQANQLYQLLQKEADIKVFFVQTNKPYVSSLVAKIKGLRAVIRLVSYIIEVSKLTKQVDVIHVLSNSGWSWQLFSTPVIWIAYLRRTPVIINYRGGEAKTYFEKSIKWVEPSMKRASAIVVPSGYLKHVFAEFNFKTQVIANIIDIQRFHPVPNKQFNNNEPHLIVTRNLEEIYGITTAIKAVALVVKNKPNLTLSIAGSGPQKEFLQQLAIDLGVEKNVIFTGKLKPDEIATLYQNADIMLNPTTVDNMPNSVLEAMATGVAIISTNVGGIPFVVEENKTALLVDVNDDIAMAEKIMVLLDNSELQNKLIKNGLLEVQQYAWEHIKKQWIDLYKLLGNHQ